jgi:transcriptional regulator with XRE-family HTH domain
MTIEKFAEFVVKLRKEKCYTQEELAKRLFVTNKAVSKWERGLNYPDIATLGLLAKELDVSIIELLNGEKKVNLNKVEDKGIDEAVKTTLDFSKQLLRNQKKNYLNQGLIIIIVFLLVLVGYQGYNQMYGLFGSSVSILKQEISDLKTMILELKLKSEAINVYGNGIYYCYSPESTFDSIEFVSPDVIRVYSFAVPESYRQSSNNYFRILSIGKNKFTITGDVIRDDTIGDFNYEGAKVSWGSDDLFKEIEISEDHKILYYGRIHSTNYCYLNSRPQ